MNNIVTLPLSWLMVAAKCSAVVLSKLLVASSKISTDSELGAVHHGISADNQYVQRHQLFHAVGDGIVGVADLAR